MPTKQKLVSLNKRIAITKNKILSAVKNIVNNLFKRITPI